MKFDDFLANGETHSRSLARLVLVRINLIIGLKELMLKLWLDAHAFVKDGPPEGDDFAAVLPDAISRQRVSFNLERNLPSLW